VTIEHPTGTLWSVPVGWTDVALADPYLKIGRARSYFRVEDLVQLAALIASQESR
jgi:Family of unknown function (DUF5372)